MGRIIKNTRTVPGPGVSAGDSNVNGAKGHDPGPWPYLGRLGFKVRRRYRLAVIGDGGSGGGGGLSTMAYAHSTGTLHTPYILATSSASTGLMQKSLKRSQSDRPFTWSMPSSAARASATGVDGSKFAASAAAIWPGVNPRKPEFSPYMASPAASAAARPASTFPPSFSAAGSPEPEEETFGVEGASSDVLSSPPTVLSSPPTVLSSELVIPSLAIAAIGMGDTPGVMPFWCLGAEKSPGTSTYGGFTLTNASGCPTSFLAPVSSTPPPC